MKAFAARNRARLVVAMFLALTVLAVPDAILGPGFLTGPGLLLLAAAALAVGAWCRAVPASAAVVVGAAASTVAVQLATPGAYSVANDAVFVLVVLGGPALVGATWSARSRQRRQLEELTAVRTQQVQDAVRVARLEEVNRVASALQHDVIQSLGGIAVRAQGAVRADVDAAGAALADIEDKAREVLNGLREHIGVLRAPGPDEGVRQAVSAEPVQVPVRPALGLVDVLAGLTVLPLAVEVVTSGQARGPAWANVLAVLLLGVPLLLRRRYPLAAAVAALALGTACGSVLTPWDGMVSSILPLLLVAYAVGAYLRGRLRRLTGLLVLLLGAGSMAVVGPGRTEADSVSAIAVVLLLAFLSGTVSAGQADRLKRLDRLAFEVEANRVVQVRLAAARQRHALARDLHDSVAAAVTVVCLHAGAARKAGLRPDADRARRSEALDTITTTARAGLAELRASLELLDSDPLAGSAGLTVADALADATRAGLSVRLEERVADLPDSMAPLAARVVREGLVNASRHAPGAQVTVRVRRRGPWLEVRISDSGAPTSFPDTPMGTGTGLTGLAERLAASGGTLRYGAVRPQGFELVARLPLLQEQPA